MNDTEKIVHELNRRFAVELPDFYRRRLIFWHDEEREFEESIKGLTLESAKVLVLEEDGLFKAKKTLLHDDRESNYLVYCPLAFAEPEDNWLLDLELYNEEFRADIASVWLEDMNLPNTPELRRCVREHRKFFASMERRKNITALKQTPNDYEALRLSVMSVLAGLTRQPGLRAQDGGKVIMSVLMSGLSAQSERDVWREFVKYGVDGAFWEMSANLTGYEGVQELDGLAVYVLSSASAHVMACLPEAGSAGNAYCYDMVSECMTSKPEEYRELAAYVEDAADIRRKFEALSVGELAGLTALAGNNIFPCVDGIVLSRLMGDIEANIIEPDTITMAVESRKLCVWYEGLRHYYGGLSALGDMQRFCREHGGGFHDVDARAMWLKYEGEYYRMDTYYRKFRLHYEESLKDYNGELGDMFKGVAERAEDLYTWYLSELGACWCRACAGAFREDGRIKGFREQERFYDDYVSGAGVKVFVIISDALRYEVAVSLKGELERDTRCNITFKALQGIFPTTTKYGMAALLPHKKLTVERRDKGLAVLADGVSSESTYRDKILKARNKNSVALRYQDIVSLKRAERQSLVRGMEIVYIYHSTIDEAGHSGRSVFGACEEAVAELKNMVKIITSDLAGTKIIITADHGFMYTASPLREYDMVGLEAALPVGQTGGAVEVGRRYAIMTAGMSPELLLPVKFFEGYEAFTPSENVRIKQKGSNANFVHGGLSLQELAVPLIDYKFLRADSSEYRNNRSKYDTKPVRLGLLTPGRKVNAMVFPLRFWQKEAVGSNREACAYRIYFADSKGNVISDTVRLIADRTTANEQERIYTCALSLKAGEYDSHETYYLVMTNEHGESERIEFQIAIVFA